MASASFELSRTDAVGGIPSAYCPGNLPDRVLSIQNPDSHGTVRDAGFGVRDAGRGSGVRDVGPGCRVRGAGCGERDSRTPLMGD